MPIPVGAREISGSFQVMVHKKSLVDLAPRLERARSSVVASFADGVLKDVAAVSAAITVHLGLACKKGGRPAVVFRH